MKALINKISQQYLIFTNILYVFNKKFKFLFYSEDKTYQKYSYNIIRILSKRYPNQVFYTSSDPNDKIKNLNVKNIFVGDGFFAKLFFLILKAEYFFLTLTDLDNHSLKKTKNVKKYIYYFHAPVSTFKNYTETAFDNYDIILCNGPNHITEIRKREKLKNLKEKKLIKTGYFYFDYLSEKISLNIKPNKVLVAPSWNYDCENFINENFVRIIDTLLKKKFFVIFRPHPEHFKRSKNILENIRFTHKDSNLFHFDDTNENINSMEKSKCLITDASGISIEYLFLTKRPVLYLNDIDKVHNKDFLNYSNIDSIDSLVKNNFGYNFYIKDIDKIDLIIDEAIKNLNTKIPLLSSFVSDNFFNFGSTKKNFDLIIENQILNNK